MSELSEQSEDEVGAVQVHKKVIQEIVNSVIEETDGVNLGKKETVSDFVYSMTGDRFPAVKVTFQPNNEAVVDVKIHVRYGLNITSVSRRLQDTLKAAIERLTDVRIKSLNISVHGIYKES